MKASAPGTIHKAIPVEDVFGRGLRWLPTTIRGHVVAIIGELVGTTSFLFFAFAGTQVANVASNTNTGTTVVTTVAQKTPQELLYISLSFGFSLAVNAWVFFRISGGLFNPAVCFPWAVIAIVPSSYFVPSPGTSFSGLVVGRHADLAVRLRSAW